VIGAAMGVSSIIVAVHAVMLRRVEQNLG